MSGPFIVRVQSADQGTKRISTSPSQPLNNFFLQLVTLFKLEDKEWNLWIDRQKTQQIKPSTSKSSLYSFNIKHGDMLFLEIISPSNQEVSEVSTQSNPSLSQAPEDEVDQLLWKLDGKIYRKKNEQLCHHGPMGKCIHCVPIEPYDEEYLSSINPPIKFLSFHSYLRKLTGGVNKGKYAALENTSCKIKSGCKEHPPWPAGICTKCQPNAVTLQRQKFRHVDFIQFENSTIANRFLDFWRSSGSQRIGLLFGRYEYHKDIPLGIRAVVVAIYEPPQVSNKNCVELLDDQGQVESVNNIASKLGLTVVGWIFTDLVSLDISKGTVKHFRGNMNTHFLSAEECILAADFQNKYPNPCRLASEGVFGSKFVTVVVTGDSTNQIHFDGYQVSDQCMALVRDECLVPTVDAPELGYIKESSNEQYVPDVFYKIKDGYGNEVTQLARPLPVEYLLLDIPVAFPKEQAFSFFSKQSIIPFPIENREQIKEVQNFDTFYTYMRQFSKNEYMDAFKDFHLLCFMATFDMLPLRDAMDDLLKALKSSDSNLLEEWFKSEAWSTVEHIMEAHGSPLPQDNPPSHGGPSPPGASSDSSQTWSCKHCTFLNPLSNQNCEMCSLPRN